MLALCGVLAAALGAKVALGGGDDTHIVDLLRCKVPIPRPPCTIHHTVNY
jgi:hypothetical protein